MFYGRTTDKWTYCHASLSAHSLEYKYRYSVLVGGVQKRCRTVLIEICVVEGVSILIGVESKDHMHLEYCPSQDIRTLVKKLKERSSRKLQMEFPMLNKKYWGRNFWAIGFGCWSTGNITNKMVNEYLKHHRTYGNDTDAFKLE